MARPRWHLSLGVAAVCVLVLTGAVGTVESPRDRGTVRGAAAGIEECTEITEPGRYEIAESHRSNGTVTSTACLTIRADDVVLVGNGHGLASNGASNTTGILVLGTENVTIRNLSITGWHRGVVVTGRAVTIRNLTVRNNAFGISLRNADHVAVNDTRIQGNLVGMRIRDARFRHANVTIRHNGVPAVVAGRPTDRVGSSNGTLAG